MSKISTVLFDFDNTLANRQTAAKKMIRNIIEIDFPVQQYGKEFQEEVFRFLYQCDKGGRVSKNEVFIPYIEKYHIQKDWKWYSDYWFKYMGQNTTPFPDTLRVLSALKQKYPIGLITNGGSTQWDKLHAANVATCFDEVVLAGEYGVYKPDPRIFLYTCEKMAVRPEECVYIGDGIDIDIKGALSVGMQAIWISDNPSETCDLPCQRIYEIKDLLLCL